MKRLSLLVLVAFALACGPSKAQQAFETCKQHMAARNWRPAVAACKLAVDLDKTNRLYRETRDQAHKELVRTILREAAERRRLAEQDARADALVLHAGRQARALEDAMAADPLAVPQ